MASSHTSPTTIGDFAILPLIVSAHTTNTTAHSSAAPAITHYLYIKPHTPSTSTAANTTTNTSTSKSTIAEQDTATRSLFATNLPIDATPTSLRALFREHLGGAMLERVDFDGECGWPRERVYDLSDSYPGADAQQNNSQGKKRKRDQKIAPVVQSMRETADTALPSLWPGTLRRSGSSAVLVFVDRESAKGAMKEVRRVAKQQRGVKWASDAVMGVERYKHHITHLYPPTPTLTHSTNTYLSHFTAYEKSVLANRTHVRTAPDENGFITVVRGGRTGPARLEEAEKKKEELEKRRAASRVGEDFYRFQNRERRKEEEGRLRRKFEEDRRRVVEMRGRRGAVRPER